MAVPKGVRYGGRQIGTRNKKTLERLGALSTQLERDVSPPSSPATMMPKDVMIIGMRHFMGLAARHQVRTDGAGDEKLYAMYLEKAIDAASKIAPYYHARLAQTTLRTDDNSPMETKLVVEFVNPTPGVSYEATARSNGSDTDSTRV